MNTRKNKEKTKKGVSLTLFFLVTFGVIYSAQAALTLGKTYDQTNYQEVRDMLMPPVLNWVKKGEWIIKTGNLSFDWKLSASYLQASLKNEGKYDVDNDWNLIEISSRKSPDFVFGLPFPKVDPKSPKIAILIGHNNDAVKNRPGAVAIGSLFIWVGKGGREREMNSAGFYLYFNQRLRGHLPNKEGYKDMKVSYSYAPMEMLGTSSMYWGYKDSREDSAWAYVPMLRRIRRVSATERSNPVAGSDLCTDDAFGWDGKVASMNWRFIGEKTILAPFTSSNMVTMKELPDETFERNLVFQKRGYETPGWKGAPWALPGLIWTPRPVWLVEITPKNLYYNYGKQILYIDKSTYCIYLKEIYDKSGTYWKSILVSQNPEVTENKQQDFFGASCGYVAIDDQIGHATNIDLLPNPIFKGAYFNLPPKKLGRGFFTETNITQLSK